MKRSRNLEESVSHCDPGRLHCGVQKHCQSELTALLLHLWKHYLDRKFFDSFKTNCKIEAEQEAIGEGILDDEARGEKRKRKQKRERL